MKRSLIIMLYLAFVGVINAQNPSDIYMIGTSRPIPGSYVGIFDGFGKSTMYSKSWHRSEPMIYKISSVDKQYEMWLLHFDYIDSTKPVIIAKWPLSKLSNYNVIDIDEFIRTKTQAEVWQWMMDNSDKKVWVIDRNDFYNAPHLVSTVMVKLVQTQIDLNDIPDDVLNPLPTTVYVMFTSVNFEDAIGIRHRIAPYYDHLRYTPRIFTVQNRNLNYFYKFAYYNKKDEQAKPIIELPQSALSTIEYVDWDIIAPSRNAEEVKNIMEFCASRDNLYFIDKKEIANGIMKAIPVKRIEPSF